MFKVLALLVVSMSVGALILSRLEPGRERMATTVLLSAQGRAPEAAAPADGFPWARTTVFCEAISGRNLLPIIGNGSSHPAHVRIKPDGLLEFQPAWYRRQVFSDEPSALRVGIELPSQARGVSSTQLKSLDALLGRLKSTLTGPGDVVRFQSFHSAVPDLGRHLKVAREQLMALSRLDG